MTFKKNLVLALLVNYQENNKRESLFLESMQFWALKADTKHDKTLD